MALTIPSYPNPYDAANPLANAFAWISFLALDANAGGGRVVLNIHPSAAAADASPPISQLPFDLGQVLVPGTPAGPGGTPAAVPAVAFPSLAALMGDAAFAAAYQAIQAKLEDVLIAVPVLAGSTRAA